VSDLRDFGSEKYAAHGDHGADLANTVRLVVHGWKIRLIFIRAGIATTCCWGTNEEQLAEFLSKFL
jgi:hypothetical protein